MKVIAIAAVTAGGKTTIVNELKNQIANTKALYFDDYSFEGEVDNFYEWTKQGADYNVWNLSPLVEDVIDIKNSDTMDSANLRNLRRFYGGDPAGKIHMLLEYAGRPGEEVADPWYTGDFQATWEDVSAGCAGLLEQLTET